MSSRVFPCKRKSPCEAVAPNPPLILLQMLFIQLVFSIVTMLPLSFPYFLFLLGNAIAFTVPSRSLYQRVTSGPDCQNTNSHLNALCWDVLNMDAWMQKWNKTTTTCHSDELWANCFMREAGMPETEAGGKIGCAQVGPNTCPEPSKEREDLASASIEMRYGAYSIWCRCFLQSVSDIFSRQFLHTRLPIKAKILHLRSPLY